MGIGICRTCGTEFERHGQAPYKYCEEHRVSDAERRARAQRNLRKRRRATRSPAQCCVCGTTFLAMRSDAKTCSPECHRVEANRRGREFEQRERGHCIDCGASTARRSTRCKDCSIKVLSVLRRGVLGEKNAAWKGGRTQSKGYVYLLVNPLESKGRRYRAEHIVVWERVNGKPLPKGWLVHHLNGVKDDNRPENLVGLPRKEHSVWTLVELAQKRIRELELNGYPNTKVSSQPE